MRILVVEDDDIFGQGLCEYLRGQSYVVHWSKTIADARDMIKESFDLVLLDWNLPDGSGVEWMSNLAKRKQRPTTIMMTARDLLSDKVHGLTSGADDYLVKPFALEELLARIIAVKRRTLATIVEINDISIDISNKSVTKHNVLLKLTAKEWAVLEALASRQGIVSRAQLEQLVFGFSDESLTNSLEVHISALRKKIGKNTIQTQRGLGYILNRSIS